MPTLILTPRYTDDSIALWRAAGKLGWSVERMSSFRPPEGFTVDDEPVLYVEALIAPLFAEALDITLLEPAIDWLPRLPYEFRKRNVTLTILGDARGLHKPQFVKPPNEKSFRAGVYEGSVPTEYPDDMPVLVSDVANWEVEFRCFILDRTIQTFSVYLRNGELQREAGFQHTATEEEALFEFMSRLLADDRVDFARAAVVDAGIIKDHGWAVVEQNAAWGSGIYGCDPERVLHVLVHAVKRNA